MRYFNRIINREVKLHRPTFCKNFELLATCMKQLSHQLVNRYRSFSCSIANYRCIHISFSFVYDEHWFTEVRHLPIYRQKLGPDVPEENLVSRVLMYPNPK